MALGVVDLLRATTVQLDDSPDDGSSGDFLVRLLMTTASSSCRRSPRALPARTRRAPKPATDSTVGDLAERFPEHTYDVQHVPVDGDVITFHSHATLCGARRRDPGKGLDITDRWRVVDGQVVDHWDPVPPVDLLARSYMLFAGGRVRNDNGSYRGIVRVFAPLPDVRSSARFEARRSEHERDR